MQRNPPAIDSDHLHERKSRVKKRSSRTEKDVCRRGQGLVRLVGGRLLLHSAQAVLAGDICDLGSVVVRKVVDVAFVRALVLNLNAQTIQLLAVASVMMMMRNGFRSNSNTPLFSHQIDSITSHLRSTGSSIVFGCSLVGTTTVCLQYWSSEPVLISDDKEFGPALDTPEMQQLNGASMWCSPCASVSWRGNRLDCMN